MCPVFGGHYKGMQTVTAEEQKTFRQQTALPLILKGISPEKEDYFGVSSVELAQFGAHSPR
jgi:hypothetical protein